MLATLEFVDERRRTGFYHASRRRVTLRRGFAIDAAAASLRLRTLAHVYGVTRPR